MTDSFILLTQAFNLSSTISFIYLRYQSQYNTRNAVADPETVYVLVYLLFGPLFFPVLIVSMIYSGHSYEVIQ